jgi:hypothetical protein
MSELVNFAKAELRASGWFDADADYDGAIAPVVVSMMETFTAYGQSGGSADITVNVFAKLARHIPLTPLTGEDDEWYEPLEMSEPRWQQNKRCHTIFRDKDRAWDSARGDKTVTFPYTVE